MRGIVAVLLACTATVQGRRELPHNVGISGYDAEHPALITSTSSTSPAEDYAAALADLDLDAVRADIRKLLTDSQELWPADYGNYGPLFVRQAWHCSGSYRTSDGRGGCAGGRQRFEPERSWPDNTNLDKPKDLLAPIKEKYGLGLSWGDLMILAGNTAIESMGGPVLGFCAGRIDDDSGVESLQLGPSSEQIQHYPCPVNGKCKMPLGSTTVGLIYLNPEGPMGIPEPSLSAHDVRDAFGRMAMNDTETVALIGGGHAFGKTHGACPYGPGPAPKDAPGNPWPGSCGTGKGADAFTSGFEGPWTSNPTHWDNEYFQTLSSFNFYKHKGPGGHFQWAVNATKSPTAPPPASNGKPQRIMMLTSDISLTIDHSYKSLVDHYAADLKGLENDFAHAWYKLTTRDMGPITRCLKTKDLPPPQPFQYPLPEPPAKLADFTKVGGELMKSVLPAHAAELVTLAFQCANTFRSTDYQGGCNGARIRYAPESEWEVNTGLEAVINTLQSIHDEFEGLSWSDLIVYAGSLALQTADAQPGAQIGDFQFCPGRTDASDGVGSQYLKPWISGEWSDTVDLLRETILRSGLTDSEAIVLMGRLRSEELQTERGFTGSWTTTTEMSNAYFKVLTENKWDENVDQKTGVKQYKAAGKELYMMKTDLLLLEDSKWKAIVENYAMYNDLFLMDFKSAWTKLMNLDRFKGPTANICDDAGANLVIASAKIAQL